MFIAVGETKCLVTAARITNQYWDGTINNIACEIGVYVYYANITFTNGQQTLKKGNVTLIR
jgi:hypothetical protein